MNLMEDIIRIVKDDDVHFISLKIAWDGIDVYLDFDPTKESQHDCIIPIHYCIVDEFAYIPHDEFCKHYNPFDYGLSSSEIKLINDVMEYLESYKTEISELCKGLDWGR